MANSTLIITMRYQDAPAAIEWLCEAFGFEKHLVVPGGPGQIAHAQLKLGNAMIMLGSEREDEFSKYIQSPGKQGGMNTMTPYMIIPEIDAHYTHAIAHGAKVARDIQDEPYGGRGYTCVDLEGYVWNFGSYDPWA